MDILHPHLVQRFVDGVFFRGRRDVVQAEGASLPGGEGFGLELFLAGREGLLAEETALVLGVGGGGGF